MERLIIFKFTDDQLKQFRNVNVFNHPITTDTTIITAKENIECAWCTSIITDTPQYIYKDLDEDHRDKIGQFCNMIICKFAFNKYYCNNIHWESIRTEVYLTSKKVISKIHYPIPPQLELKKYGGTKTFDEYKQDLVKIEKSIGL